MKLLSTRYLSSLTKSFQKLVLGLMMVLPLLALSPASRAAEQGVEFSQAELDQMLAPIALYPDALLSQVLIASTYPLEVIQADRWVRSNKDLSAEDALKFAENKNWDPSVKALVAFPDILKRMSEDVDWTQRLGDAFLNNEGDVMDAVQRLRKRAYATGNLEKAQHISVERDDNNIIIEPTEERIVYVPVYDTRVVYGNWWWPDYPPVYWHYPTSYTYVSGFYWGPRIHLGPTYFFSSCHWRDRRIVVIDRHHPNTHFYTGRSIVRHDSARPWSHNPAHRQGVAYYNNRLRDTYHSPRPSYQHDRQYRQQHQNGSRWDHNDNRTGNSNDGNPRYDSHRPNHSQSNSRPFDRSEHIRERLSRTQNNGGNDGVVTESNQRENRPWRHNGANREISSPTQGDVRPNFNVGRDEATARHPGAMQVERHNSVNANPVNQERQVITTNENHRAVFQGAAEQAREQQNVNVGPQQRVERNDNPTFTQPRNESRGEQRSERGNHIPRFSREKSEDNTK